MYTVMTCAGFTLRMVQPGERTWPTGARPRLCVGQLLAQSARWRYQEEWHRRANDRAKVIRAVKRKYQLDFVDVALMATVDGEVHVERDRLLEDAFTASSRMNYDVERAGFHLPRATAGTNSSRPSGG